MLTGYVSLVITVCSMLAKINYLGNCARALGRWLAGVHGNDLTCGKNRGVVHGTYLGL